MEDQSGQNPATGFCPACGTEAVPNDRFCYRCGNPLPARSQQSEGEADPAVPPITPAAPGTAPPPPGFPVGGPPPVPAPNMPYPTPPQAPPPPPPMYQGAAYPPSPPPPPPVYPGAYAPPPGQYPPGQYAPGQYPPGQYAPGQYMPVQYMPDPGARLASFGAPLARWWQRVGSMLLDGLIVFVPLLIINAILNAAFGTEHLVRSGNGLAFARTIQGPAHVAIVILMVAIEGLYFSILNGVGGGQTVGNRAPGIAVRDAVTGEAIGFGRAVLRWFIRFILYAALILPGLLNDLFPLWDSRRQTIADKAARSVVIRLK
jgi:uncharacterized RDD family membrane protein YckC